MNDLSSLTFRSPSAYRRRMKRKRLEKQRPYVADNTRNNKWNLDLPDSSQKIGKNRSSCDGLSVGRGTSSVSVMTKSGGNLDMRSTNSSRQHDVESLASKSQSDRPLIRTQESQEAQQLPNRAKSMKDSMDLEQAQLSEGETNMSTRQARRDSNRVSVGKISKSTADRLSSKNQLPRNSEKKEGRNRSTSLKSSRQLESEKLGTSPREIKLSSQKIPASCSIVKVTRVHR